MEPPEFTYLELCAYLKDVGVLGDGPLLRLYNWDTGAWDSWLTGTLEDLYCVPNLNTAIGVYISPTYRNVVARVETDWTNDTDLWYIYLYYCYPSPSPSICREPAELTPSCPQGHNPPEDSFEVWNCGQGTLAYTVDDNVDWLACSPPNGTSTGGPNTHKVTYDTAGLSPGTYSATITISDPAAGNDPQAIAVTLTVGEGFLIGGQVSTDPQNMIFTGINGVRIDVTGPPGSFWTETMTILQVPGMWEIDEVPVGTYTVTATKEQYAFIHMVAGKLGQPAPITIEVNQANQAKNQNIVFLAHVLGDLNCDELVNFDDIDPFVLALGGEPGYAAQYPDCIWRNADCNQDGTVDFHDIDPFVALLIGGGCG